MQLKQKARGGMGGGAADMGETTGQGHMGQGFDQGNLGRGFDNTGAGVRICIGATRLNLQCIFVLVARCARTVTVCLRGMLLQSTLCVWAFHAAQPVHKAVNAILALALLSSSHIA